MSQPGPAGSRPCADSQGWAGGRGPGPRPGGGRKPLPDLVSGPGPCPFPSEWTLGHPDLDIPPPECWASLWGPVVPVCLDPPSLCAAPPGFALSPVCPLFQQRPHLETPIKINGTTGPGPGRAGVSTLAPNWVNKHGRPHTRIGEPENWPLPGPAPGDTGNGKAAAGHRQRSGGGRLDIQCRGVQSRVGWSGRGQGAGQEPSSRRGGPTASAAQHPRKETLSQLSWAPALQGVSRPSPELLLPSPSLQPGPGQARWSAPGHRKWSLSQGVPETQTV